MIQPNGSSLWNNGTTINPFSQGDTIESQFAEIKVPITSPQNAIPGAYLLTLDGAVRHEIYSGGNTVTVPKYSVRYLPMNDDFGFRATFGKSFEAPTLYDLYGPSSSGFTSSPGGLNAYNSAGVATGAKFPNLQAQQASQGPDEGVGEIGAVAVQDVEVPPSRPNVSREIEPETKFPMSAPAAGLNSLHGEAFNHRSLT